MRQGRAGTSALADRLPSDLNTLARLRVGTDVAQPVNHCGAIEHPKNSTGRQNAGTPLTRFPGHVMNPTKNQAPSRHVERTAFGALWVFLFSPVIAHGLWRPLVHIFGPAGSAATVTMGALAIGGVVAAVSALGHRTTRLLSLLLGGVVALAATVGCSLGLPGLLSLLVVATALAFLLPWLSAQLPATLDGLAKRHKVLCALYVLFALAAVIKTAHVSIFIGDPTRVDRQAVPGERFLETHSCLTAYVHADALSRQRVDNLYADRHWLGSNAFPVAPAGSQNPYQPFLLDYFAYPPPFLLAVTPLAFFAGDFAAQRALWFFCNALVLAIGLWTVARWLDGPGAHRAFLLAPIFFGCLPVLATLQTGNFQIAVVMISILAMVAFDRDRPALGGALLAFAVLSKLSPAVLGIVLLVQRRIRPAAWTAGFGVIFVLLSLLMLGTNPMVSFLTYTLPRLSTGAAFTFMDDDPFSIFTNMAPFGLPFKLQLAGLDISDPWALGRRIGRVYSVLLAIMTIVAARRTQGRHNQAVVWMSLLVLAALQSPFAPGYVTIGLLWAITLLTAEVQTLRGGILLVLLWLLITIIPPIPNPQLFAAFFVLQSIVTLCVPAWLICRRRDPIPFAHVDTQASTQGRRGQD